MALALQSIKRAYRLLTVIDPDEDLTATQSAIGVEVLNDMLNQWQADGLAIGFTPLVSITDTLTVPADTLEAIAQNLACKLAPEFGVAIPDWLGKDAQRNYVSVQLGVITATGTATALNLIYRAYRLAKPGLTATPIMSSEGIQALNEMMSTWQDNGLESAYVPITALTDTPIITASNRDAVIYGLALRIADQSPTPPDASLQQKAADGYQRAVQALVDDTSSTTAEGLIYRAYRIAKVPLTTLRVKVLDAIRALNAMMALWQQNGLEPDYVPVTALSDTPDITPGNLEAVVYGLAVRIADQTSIPADKTVVALAQGGYTAALEALADATNTDIALALIYRAYRIAKIPLSSSRIKPTDGLVALNEMMARWESNGLALGWLPVAALTDTLVLLDTAREAVAYNLAIMLGDQSGAPADMMIRDHAKLTYNEILRDSLGTLRYEATTPWPERGYDGIWGWAG